MLNRMRGSAHGFGLRTVAIFEGIKGVLFQGLGYGILALRHTNVHATVDALISRIGLNPEAHYTRLMIERLASVSDKGLCGLAVLALVISLLRFSEAFGLWFEKAWAEWLTLISAGVYLPVEIHHVLVRPGWVWSVILAGNAAIVVYLALVIASQKKRPVSLSTEAFDSRAKASQGDALGELGAARLFKSHNT